MLIMWLEVWYPMRKYLYTNIAQGRKTWIAWLNSTTFFSCFGHVSGFDLISTQFLSKFILAFFSIKMKANFFY